MSAPTRVDSSKLLLRLLAPAILTATSTAAQAEDRFEFGVRGQILVSDGEPANDVTGYGVLFRSHLDGGWAWGLAVDVSEFDFEQPARLLGIEQDDTLEAIDAKADMTDVSAFIERHHAWNDDWSWFWQAGGGFGSVDVPDAAGPTADGGTFLIQTDASTEGFLVGALGATRRFGSWSVEGAVVGQYRFTDYELRDTVSGVIGTVDGHFPIGVYLALAYRF